MDALFDIAPTGRPARTVGPMPGDTVQPDLFGGADVVVARNHVARPVVVVADPTPAMFAVDVHEFDGQGTWADVFGQSPA